MNNWITPTVFVPTPVVGIAESMFDNWLTALVFISFIGDADPGPGEMVGGMLRLHWRRLTVVQ